MADEQEAWLDFKAKMAKHRVCTSYAARAVLVQEYVQQEIACKQNEDSTTLNSDTLPLNSPALSNDHDGDGIFHRFHASISDLNNELQSSMFPASNAKSHSHKVGSARNIHATIGESIETNRRAAPRRNSFTLEQVTRSVSPPPRDKALYSSALKTRRQKFDKMIGVVVGKQSSESQDICSTKNKGTFDLGLSSECHDSAESSLQSSFSLFDQMDDALSSYVSGFACEPDDKKSNTNERCTTNLDRKMNRRSKSPQRSLNASVKNFFASSRSILETPQNLSAPNLGVSDVDIQPV